jgi:hypothetical protein
VVRAAADELATRSVRTTAEPPGLLGEIDRDAAFPFKCLDVRNAGGIRLRAAGRELALDINARLLRRVDEGQPVERPRERVTRKAELPGDAGNE